MTQIVHTGSNSIEFLNQILKRNNCKKILVIAGKTFQLYIKKFDILNKYDTHIFSDFITNTQVKDVKKLAKLIKNKKPDIIIAIGGGGTIDIAKQSNVLSCLDTLDNLEKDIINNTLDIKHNGFPLVAIPTTAGTGSEATQFSVVYINNIKFSVDNIKLLPQYVILDHSLIKNSPKNLIATTAMDALTQSIESLWSIKSTKESREYATQAIKLILQHIKIGYISSYTNDDSASSMQLAAHLSGKAINISRTTAAHALSYPLTIHHKISHGHAVALTLPKFIQINSETSKYEINDTRGVEFINSIMKQLYKLFSSSTYDECIEFFNSLMDDLSLERNFKNLGIESSRDIDRIINEINIERFNNNPVKISLDTVKDIFKQNEF